MSTPARVDPERAAAHLEVLDRLASVRAVADAVLTGEWKADPALLEAMERLTASAAAWATRAAA